MRKILERSARRRSLGLSLEVVSRHFRGGVSRVRIRAIERAERVRPETLAAYEAAINAAVAERKRAREIFGRLRAELNA